MDPKMLLLIISVLCGTTVVQVGGYTGGDCFNERRQQAGLCIQIKNCESAVKNVHNINSIDYPQICRYENLTPFVCCPTGTSGSSGSSGLPGKKAEAKCQEYSEKYLNIITDSRNKQILDGEDASFGEFPHMAAIGFGDSKNPAWSCGGVLISEKFVLTVAHCRTHPTFGAAKFVMLGDISLQNISIARRVYQISTFISHPSYKSPRNYDDIALIELSTVVDISPSIKPACLHTNNDTTILQNYKTEVTGWGWDENDEPKDTLQKVELQYFDDCHTKYKPNDSRKLPQGIIDSKQICFGSRVDRKDACKGDSGGPIQYFDFEVYLHRVVGLVSSGKGCGVIGTPGIYTKVSSYVNWIENIVWK